MTEPSLARNPRDPLARIALQMVSSLDLQIVLTTITQGLVEELDKAFARSLLLIRDHQHVQDVVVGEAFGKELGLGHYKILATVSGETVAGTPAQATCRF